MISSNRFWKTIWKNLPEVSAFLNGTYHEDLPDKVQSQLKVFIDILSGEKNPDSRSFMSLAAEKVLAEWKSSEASDFIKNADEIVSGESLSSEEMLDLFFPEFKFGGDSAEEQEAFLRNRRTVTIQSLNPSPVSDPSSDLIFTSNVLLTLPTSESRKKLSPEMKKRISPVEKEDQKYWFDHPILMGVDRDANEMIYGLKGLAESFAYEKAAGIARKDGKMTVILSLSVTHNGLKGLAHEYLSSELKGCSGLEDLEIYLFTEEDTEALSELLAGISGQDGHRDDIKAVFGVDGRYGRHYSFLKAIVPLWALVVNPDVKGTFKIDLDQVFPQKELKEQTGMTAFEHFKTPLWGARGIDSRGREVEMGMIAGALVNEKDIGKSLFTPDVPLPPAELELTGESRIFHKQYPMAVSTLAEMMTIYGEKGKPDGREKCLSRVHVTGGTNGILCSSLRRKRPFTPSFIGRAEDQAYLLSVLTDKDEPALRYVHEAGLIMRHDKEAFAGESIAAAKLGTWVADLLRIIYFSYYAEFLPGGTDQVKEELDPFTGCFISSTPLTKVFIRLVLKVLESPGDSQALLDLAETQLSPFLTDEENRHSVRQAWYDERRGWNVYYDALDLLEEGIRGKKREIEDTAVRLKDRMLGCRIS